MFYCISSKHMLFELISLYSTIPFFLHYAFCVPTAVLLQLKLRNNISSQYNSFS